MKYFSGSLSLRDVGSAAAVLALGAAIQSAGVAQQLHTPASTPAAVTRMGVSLGLESPSAPVSATVWLPLHDKAAFDEAVRQMYLPGSPTYHRWMQEADLKRFQPTAAEVAAVEAELAAHHLAVVAVDQANYSVTLAGQVADFESAFQTQLNRYRVGTRTVRTALREPQLTGAAGSLVQAVTGFEGPLAQPMHAVPLDLRTGRQLGIRPVAGPVGNAGPAASAGPDGAVFSNSCFYDVTTVSLAGPSATTGSYTGLGYGASPLNTKQGTVGPCGYSPQDVWKLYNLSTVYAQGHSGQGQTVVVVDAYGSPTLTADATTFSSLYSLPAPTATSLKLYTPKPFAGTDPNWALETTLDVEWAHAIAPDANIALVVAASANDNDLQSAILYAVNNHLGSVISNSYGGPESFSSPATLATWDQINELAAAKGISVHYATGDNGDYAAQLGYKDVSSPADSTYATAVGGTTIGFSPLDGSTVQTGWGNNASILSTGNSVVSDPPTALGFLGGAGGGVSTYFSKPGFQAKLAGPGRHLPDVSAIADPYTGVEIIFTVSGAQYYEVVGGTSLATPVFSAIWALAEQFYGPLGQAAPFVAAGSPFLVDVVGAPTEFDTSGTIKDAKGTTNYSAIALAGPLGATTQFASALWNAGGGTFYNLTFGTDSSLTVTPGWDDVTGYGTPNFAVLGH